jgi:hypothetical protein
MKVRQLPSSPAVLANSAQSQRRSQKVIRLVETPALATGFEGVRMGLIFT